MTWSNHSSILRQLRYTAHVHTELIHLAAEKAENPSNDCKVSDTMNNGTKAPV
jgi:hypothetical protein